MTPEKARELLRICLEDLDKGKVFGWELGHRLWIVAAGIEPEEIMIALPEKVRASLRDLASYTLPKFEDDRWRLWGTGSRTEKPTEEQKQASVEIDRERYYGLCRLHEYLSGRGRLTIKATACIPAHPAYFDNVYSQEEIDKSLAECERIFGEIYPDSIGHLVSEIKVVLLREPGKDMGVVFQMSDSLFPDYLTPVQKEEIIRSENDFCNGIFQLRKMDIINIMERDRGNYSGKIGATFRACA